MLFDFTRLSGVRVRGRLKLQTRILICIWARSARMPACRDRCAVYSQ